MIPIANTPFKKISIYLVGPITPVTERGNLWILTRVAFATRYPEAIAVANIGTETIAEASLKIFSRVDLPKIVFSNNGINFVFTTMEEVARLLSIH